MFFNCDSFPSKEGACSECNDGITARLQPHDQVQSAGYLGRRHPTPALLCVAGCGHYSGCDHWEEACPDEKVEKAPEGRGKRRNYDGR